MSLSKEEKLEIIDSHIKNIVKNRYVFNLMIIQENSLENPNQETLDSLNLQVQDTFKKEESLQQEKENLINEQ
jgi:hypothetical protein